MVPPLCKEGIIFTPMLLASRVYFPMNTFEIWVMLLCLKMFASHQIRFEQAIKFNLSYGWVDYSIAT
jgi:hypothetical protein